MKRWAIRLGSLLVLALSIVGVRLAAHAPAPVPVHFQAERFGELKAGMSENEIAAILGVPAGDYRTRNDVHYLFDCIEHVPYHQKTTSKEWNADDCAIHAAFAPDGKAVWITYGMGYNLSPTLSERYPLLKKLEPLVHLP
jgi:hypothetical protein